MCVIMTQEFSFFFWFLFIFIFTNNKQQQEDFIKKKEVFHARWISSWSIPKE